MSDLRQTVAEALYQSHYNRPDGRTVRDEPASVEWVYHRLALAAIEIVVEAAMKAVDAHHAARKDVGRPCMSNDCTCEDAIAAIRALGKGAK